MSAPSPAVSGQALLADYRPTAEPEVRRAIAFGLGSGVLLIAQAGLLARLLDALLFERVTPAIAVVGLAGLLGVFGLRAWLAYRAERSAFRAAAAVKRALRDQAYRRIQAAGPRWLADQRSGALIEDLTKGVEALDGYYARYLPAMTLTALLPLAILLVVLPLDWLSGLVLLLTAPLIPLFMILVGQQVEALNRRQWRTLARMGAHFLDTLQGLTTLKLFNASRREAAVIAQVSDDYRRQTMAVLRVAFLTSAVLEFFATVGIALVAVLIGFRLYHAPLPLPALLHPPTLDFATGFFVLLLAPEFYLPLRNLGGYYHSRMEALTAAERLATVLHAPITPGAAPDAAPAVSADIPPEIRFEAVRFAYAPGRTALADVSFALPAGQRIALVGPSGAGKSTVVQLLLGFLQPDAGQILIDGAPLDRLPLATWRRQVAWLPQRPRLFQGTLLDNIRLGLPDASLAAVQAAARRARATEFIDRLPAGYLTVIGEGGAGLSGGQIQRIALARAFLRDARLVILDEATASLDPASEALVQAGIDELAVGRTLLVVAHRLATVRQTAHILVLVAGRIAEQGTHAELIRRDGPYRQLIAAATLDDGSAA